MNGKPKSALVAACLLLAIVFAPAGQKLLFQRITAFAAVTGSSAASGEGSLIGPSKTHWSEIIFPPVEVFGASLSGATRENRAKALLRLRAENAGPINLVKALLLARTVTSLYCPSIPAGEASRHEFDLRRLALSSPGNLTGAYSSVPSSDQPSTLKASSVNPDKKPELFGTTLAGAASDVDLRNPVQVGLSSFKPDARRDLTLVDSEDTPWLRPGPGPQANALRPPTGNTAQAVGSWGLPPSLPQAQQGSEAARILAASVIAMDTREDSIMTPPGSHQVARRYTGKLISLDLRSVDIRDFFRLIHRVSGLNIVVDSDVTGNVTLVLDDVPWDQALDLVLKNNGLGSVLEGNVLRIARVQTLEAEAEQAQQLREAKVSAEPLVTIVRSLHYASAEDLQPTMTSSSMGGMGGMGGNMGGQQKPIPGITTILKSTKGVLSSRGSVTSDPRENAVIITDVPSQLPVIDALIDKLDTKSKQLSIQVRVVLASSDFTRSLSSILSGGYKNKSGSTQTVGGTGTGIVAVPGAVGIPASGSSGTTTILSPAQTATGFGAFAITNAGARYLINAAISAAEERDQARTISRPTIVTQNNFPGTIMQGVQIPIQTSINLTVTVQYVNAALEMMVTPRVTGDNRVFLDINVNNASPGTISVADVGISINVQEATTKVLVPDGGTVVFGGITVTTRSRSANYIPLLGSVPILGNLFKSSQVSDQNQELLFFVSPTVLPD